EKVQVFDRKSEAAAFSGIDDGVRDRTINLVLRKTYESRYFGNLAAGGGTGKTAKVEGKLNRFSKTVQASVMNMYNNINEFGFTDNANRPYGQGIEGLNTNLSGGANFLYNPRGENRYFVSYLGSITRKILDEFTSTENYLPTGVYHQTLDLVKEERVEPHHINAGIRHSFNDMNRLILDGNIVFNQTGIQSLGFMNTDLTDRRINSLENKVDDSNKNKQYNGSLAYISKFNEEKTQLQLNMNGLYKKDDSFLNWSNDTFLYDSMKREFIEQMRNNELEEVFASINPTLVQKLDDSWILSASGHLGLNNENLYRKEGILNTDGSVNEQVFPDFSANESFFRPSMSLQHSSEKLLINLSLEGVFNQFDRIFSGTMIGTHYARFLPRFRFRNEYKSGRRLEATYHTTLKMPSANQLFPVPNKLNQLAIITGNMALRPEYFHDVNLTWSLFDETTFRALFVRIGGKYARDKISWSQTIREDLINIISPVNVPIDYSVDSYMNFSSPIRSLKLKANATWQEIWNRNMTYINTLENINTLLTHVVDLNLENQKKEKWNLKIGGTARVTNSGFSVADSKTYYFINTDYYTSIRFIPAKQWSFETNATIRSYTSQSFDKAVTIPLVTARMSYFFLADQRASFTLDGFDLLNTYVGFQRLSQTNYLMQREWNTISQYVMLTFSLRFL
ncbi:MAG: outer membrane beta-barrel family protein, partial [Cyclobacteriaceae bacterium]|nr:outer membrane beta-barrel family protein [Cyclobacteriaceae bacterium]